MKAGEMASAAAATKAALALPVTLRPRRQISQTVDAPSSACTARMSHKAISRGKSA